MAEEITTQEVIRRHEASGRYINVDGLRTFVRDQGQGEVVFCIHGVPTSSFLYRKILDELEKRGYRGVCIDLPGLGLTDRPKDFDYSFPSFARFCAQAAEAMGIRKFHLVVHDVGGPVGFALAAENPEKIKSLTILNTWIDVVNFEKPLPMRPFEKPVLGEAQLKMVTHPTWQLLFSQLGVNHSSRIANEEINAYVDLLKRDDGGDAFLKIMRNFDHSPEFPALCYKAVQNVPYPVQAIWGADDPGLTFDRYGTEIKEVAGLPEVHKLASRHFLQEEQWEAITDRLEDIMQQSGSSQALT